MKLNKLRVLVIGYGSIGQKHCKILKKFTPNITVLSKKKRINFKRIKNVNQIVKLNPDYIVISCETSKHYYYLNYIERHISNKIILVEKPIMEKFRRINLTNNQYYVGYNLRFHPVILFLKKNLKNKKINYVNINATSYLPNWRKNIKYEDSSSALKKKGGGLILDLSHELDYINWIFGKISLIYSYNNKISNLKINTDDFLLLFGKLRKKIKLNLCMNFFSRLKKREIIIEGKDFSLKADIIKNNLQYFSKKNKKISWPKFDINQTYINQHKNILRQNFRNLCKASEAINTLKLIDQIKRKRKLR